MKNIDKYLIIRATKEGGLQLRAKGPTMKTTINFKECKKPEWEDAER